MMCCLHGTTVPLSVTVLSRVFPLARKCAIAYAAWRLGLSNKDLAAQFGNP
jgi:hypothetical protein